MVPKVLVVGGGITGALVTRILLSEFNKINITVWEKSNELGGRFNTSYGGKQNELSINLGAQYITTATSNIKNNDCIYSDLLQRRILKLMVNRVKGIRQPQNDVTNFIAPHGMASVVEHFLNKDHCNICYSYKLIALYILGRKWCAFSESGVEETFDAVILTIPVPEILKLSGGVKSLIGENKQLSSNLNAVRYSSRYALAIFYETGTFTEYDSEYIEDDSVLRFVSYDSWKSDISNFFCAAFHTTIQFGEEYSNTDSEIVKEIILKHIHQKFPKLPKSSSVIFRKWDYSQVIFPYDSKPGAIFISEKPPLIIGGDGFSGSTFDQCLFSAKVIVCKMLLPFAQKEGIIKMPK